MGLFLQAHRAFLHDSGVLCSRDSVRLRIATADGLSPAELLENRGGNLTIELPLDRVAIVVDTQLVFEPNPTSRAGISITAFWLRVRAGLDAAAQRLLSLVQSEQ